MGGFLRKIIRRPKVQQALQAQKEAPKPKGPVASEIIDEDVKMSKIKRKGRRALKLAQEDDELKLAQKSLLG